MVAFVAVTARVAVDLKRVAAVVVQFVIAVVVVAVFSKPVELMVDLKLVAVVVPMIAVALAGTV